MAVVVIASEGREIHHQEEISRFLEPFGIWYERWPVEGRIDDRADSAAILAAYAPEIERLKQRGGFIAADVIDVHPETPNLQTMLAKFNREHFHSEDEVRFIVAGKGVFHIHLSNGPVFAIEVEAGDLINVPAGTRHWFDLCNERRIRAIRLFVDASGWTPEYIEDGVHDNYAPLCWGPSYLSPAMSRVGTVGITFDIESGQIRK